MELSIRGEQVLQCFLVLFSGVLRLVSEVLFQQLRTLGLGGGRWVALHLELLLLLVCLVRHNVVTDFREVRFELSKLLDKQLLDRVQLGLSLFQSLLQACILMQEGLFEITNP